MLASFVKTHWCLAWKFLEIITLTFDRSLSKDSKKSDVLLTFIMHFYFLNKKSGLSGSRFSIFCILQFWRQFCNIRSVYSLHQKIRFTKSHTAFRNIILLT